MDRGAAVDDGSESETPLMAAVKGGHVGSVSVLVQAGANLAAMGADGRSVVDTAREMGDGES